MNTRYIACLIGLVSVATPFVASAAILGYDGESTAAYVLPARTVIYDDFYAADKKVSLFGSVQGDAIVVAKNITSEGFIEQDALLVGATVSSRGEVGDDLRIVAASADIMTPVASDVVFVGGELTIDQAAPILGGVLAAGDVVTIRGDVSGDVKIFGNSVYIDSFIGGSVKVFAQRGVEFGPHAQVVGDVIWMGEVAPVIDNDAFVLGSVKESPVGAFIPDKNTRSLRMVSLFAATQALAVLFLLFVFGFFSSYGAQRFVSLAGDIRSLGRAALIGVIGGPLLFFGGLILLLSVAGTMVGVVVLLSLALMVVFSVAGAHLLLGKALFVMVVRKQDTVEPLWKLIFTGVVAMLLLTAVPIIGPLIFVFFFLAAFGGVLRGINVIRKGASHLVVTPIQ